MRPPYPETDWDDRSARWLAFDEELERFAAPLGELAIDKLALRPDDRVLDIGCGTGWSSVTLARAVWPAGQVVGVDIAPAMVQRARANGAGLANLEFLCADATTVAFDRPFDALFSRFGLMFFQDPPAAFTNLARCLRSGGRLAFVSWADVRTNEWFMLTGLALLSVTRAPPAYARREPFSLADPQVVNRLLTAAGFHDVRIDPRVETTTMTEAELEVRLRLSTEVTGLRESLIGLEPDLRQRGLEAVRRSLWSRVRDGLISLRVGVLVVTAIR
jgi:SAM-dependent methyltransferase